MLHKIEQDVRFQMDLKHEVKRQQSRHKRNFSKESSAENNNFSGHFDKKRSLIGSDSCGPDILVLESGHGLDHQVPTVQSLCGNSTG